MKIKFETSRFGPIEMDDSKVIDFPEGIPGFSALKRYIIMDYKDTGLKWLQSVDDPAVAFIVSLPGSVSPGYEAPVDDAAIRFLGLEKKEDLAVLLIVRVEAGNVIVNTRAPLLLNAALMRGMQLLPDRL
ncbi:MAG: flagellar assembly protein FliW [Nitrospiraceae bacterium]|nr:flagellar assembly protein FliW [Nitrospiraceae bacterium]MDA8326982.1 flagellar assembly protein FliW [Nitrospiraceae bacterium]